MKNFLWIFIFPLVIFVFIASVTCTSQAGNITLKVLGQTEFFSGSPASIRIITLDDTTEKPLEGINISVQFISRDKIVEVFSGITDKTGSMEGNFTVPSDTAGPVKIQVTAYSGKDKKEVVSDIRILKFCQFLITTDKPLYKPSQTVNIRFLALQRPSMIPVKKEPVTFEIYDGKGNKVFVERKETSDFGVASTKFDLADEVNYGEYHIKAITGYCTTEKTFSVKPYVLPKFDLSVKTDRGYYQPGQILEGSVDAGYFFGKPVSEGDVKITFSDEKAEKISEITGKTDKNGFYSFKYTFPSLPSDRKKSNIMMEIAVTDGANRQEIKYKNLILTENLIAINISPEASALVPGMENIIYVLTSYPDDTPAQTTLDIKINDKKETIKTDKYGFAECSVIPSEKNTEYEISACDVKGTRTELKGSLKADQAASILLRTDKAMYRAGDIIKAEVFSNLKEDILYIDIIRDDRTLLTKSMEIKDGKGILEWPLSSDCAGTVIVYAYRVPSKEKITGDRRKIIVTPQMNIDICTDKKIYLPGEEGEITFRVADNNGKPLVSAIGVNIIDESFRAMAGKNPDMEKFYFLLEQGFFHDYDIPAKYIPLNEFIVYLVKGFHYETSYHKISGIAIQDILNLLYRYEECKNTGEPQGLSKFKFHKITDQFDVFSLNKEGADDYVNYKENLKELYFIRRMILSALCSYVYNNKTFQYPYEISELVKGKYLEERYSIDPWGNTINIAGGGGKAMPELISSGPDGKLGTKDDINFDNIIPLLKKYLPYDDPFLSMQYGRSGEELTVTSPSTISSKSSKSSLILASVIIGTALATISSNQGYSQLPDTVQEPVKIREYFPETLYTNPEVITDEHGMAKINVKMADSITDWKLSAFASSLTGNLGNKETSIRVFQDFFTDIDLPVLLSCEDEISVPVSVYNYLPEKQHIKIELVKDSWFTLMDNPVKELVLEKDQVSSVYFRIKAGEIGLHSLTVKAKGNKISDSIKRVVKVESNLAKITETESNILDKSLTRTVEIPEDAFPGGSKIFVNIYPGFFSQIVEGLDKILRMPSGCFEQTSSTTYPDVLVLNYLKKTDKITPEIQKKAEDYISKGYQRLLTFEVKGGGFSCFGALPANKVLTAYGLMEFKDMSDVYDIDIALIKRTQDWLVKQQLKDGSWEIDRGYPGNNETLQERHLLATAYITWSLLEAGYNNKEVVDKAIDYIKDNCDEIEDPYVLAVIACAFADYNSSDPDLKEIFGQLMELKIENKENVYWTSGVPTITCSVGVSSTVETTALITCAMMKANLYPESVNKCINFLIQKKDRYGTWYSTQATALALRALNLAAEKFLQKPDLSGTILINGKKCNIFNINPENINLYQQFDLGEYRGKNNLQINIEGSGKCFYQIITEYYLPWSKINGPEEIKPVSLKISYDKLKLTRNETVTCNVEVAGKNFINMPLVELSIPPGFSVETPELDKLVENKIIDKYSITEKNIIIYLENISAGKPLVFNYRLRAKYPLKVQVPPSRVYEYYNPENVTETKPFEMLVE